MWLTSRCWTSPKPRNQSVVRSAAIAKSLPRLQRGPRMNHMCHHCELQGHTRPNCHKLRALRNASDQRSRGPKNDKRTWAIESLRDWNSVPEWWTWWRWLVHSPTVWKASLEGLKVLTLALNPIGISPQTHMTCRWRRVLMHKHYNMSMH